MAQFTEYDVKNILYDVLRNMYFNEYQDAIYNLNYILQKIVHINNSIIDCNVERYIYRELYKALIEMAMKRYNNANELIQNTYNVVSLPKNLF